MSELSPVYLIVGDDRAKISKAITRLRNRFAEEAIEQFTGGADSGADIVNACRTLGLLAAEKLVLVTAAHDLKAADVDEIIAYVASPEPAATLAMVATSLASNSRLLKACQQKPAQLLRYSAPQPKELSGWVGQLLQQEGVEASPALCRRIVDLVGNTSPARVQSEVDKLVTYLNGDPLTAKIIDENVIPTDQTVVWQISDAWAAQDRGALLTIAENLVEQREAPFRLVLLLGRHIQRVHMAKILLVDHPAASVMGMLDCKPFAAKKIVQQAGSINQAQAEAALARVSQLEAELKGAAAMASQSSMAVFQRGLAELVFTNRRPKAAAGS